MNINWRAVGIGFVVTAAVGLVTGMTLPLVGFTIPEVSFFTAGIFGGIAAGYYASNELRSGIIHGALATIAGGLLVGVLLVAIGTVGLGLGGLIGGVLGILIGLPFAAVPGAIGGALGSWGLQLQERRRRKVQA